MDGVDDRRHTVGSAESDTAPLEPACDGAGMDVQVSADGAGSPSLGHQIEDAQVAGIQLRRHFSSSNLQHPVPWSAVRPGWPNPRAGFRPAEFGVGQDTVNSCVPPAIWYDR
jgi:hypothetical protein